MKANRYKSLERQHAELEEQILVASKRPQPDEGELHDLKKRKLKLKEEMNRLESE